LFGSSASEQSMKEKGSKILSQQKYK